MPNHPRSPNLRRRIAVAILVAAGLQLQAPVRTFGQTPAASSTGATDPTPPDSAIEFYRESIEIAANGTMVDDVTARIKVNTQAGLSVRGTWEQPFERAMDTLDVRYLRVRKPDGTVVDTPLDSAIDVPAEITRTAPSYTDLYERHIAVRGLSVGDAIEFAFRLERKPILNGQFAAEQDWLLGQVVDDGEVSLSVPSAMALTVKTRGEQPLITTAGGKRTYRWRVSRPKTITAEELTALIAERRDVRSSVQISTFRSWAQVGEAMTDLWRGQTAVTPAIQQKADLLTKGLTTDADKVRALYAFVARDVRYLAVSFGVGRYQPHAAADVLANGFGDCKDKHVLLEALLRAVGIQAAPVLISPSQGFDAEVPSPVQFSHVITRVDVQPAPIWLDATLERAPAGYLWVIERDRQGLLMPATGSAVVVRTPLQPARPNAITVRTEGVLAADGSMTAKVEETFSGDLEYVLRQLLHAIPEKERQEAFRKSGMSQLGGAITSMIVGSVDDPAEPLHVTLTLKADSYSSWSQGSIEPLLPNVDLLPEAPDAGEPVKFDLRFSLRASSHLTLPAGYTITMEASSSQRVEDERDFARYRDHVSLANGALDAEREIDVLVDEVPAARAAEYAAFRRSATHALPKVRISDAWPWNSASVPRLANPGGKNPAATQLITQAARSNAPLAVDLLQKAVELEPDHPSAWSLLGQQMMYMGKSTEGEAAMRKQLAVAPSADAYKRMGTAFATQWKWASAEAAFRDGAEKYPDDRDMPALLGETLLSDGKAAEAAVVLQAEAVRRPRSSRLQSALGRAYLRSGQIDKGVAALHESVRLEAWPAIWGLAAGELADVGRDLDQAQDYAEKAVKQTLKENASGEFANLLPYANSGTARLAFYYETLGRVLVKKKDYERGQAYCEASWELAWRWRAAQCLGDIAAVRNDAAAVERYRAFVRSGHRDFMPTEVIDPGPAVKPVVPTPPAEAKANYEASTVREKMSTFPLKRPQGAKGSGRVDLLTGADGRIREVRLSNAPREFDLMVTEMLNLKVGPVLPENAQAVLLRYAWITCPEPVLRPVVTTSVRGAAGEKPESVQRAEQLEGSKPPTPLAGCTLQMR